MSDVAEKVVRLVGLFPEPRRALVTAMLDGPVGTEFMTAPASSREDYHMAFPGGLAEHSLNVVLNLTRLADALCPGRYARDRLVFVALFHDLGKAGDGERPYYVPNPADWQRQRGELYTINRTCTFMPVGERSIYLLNCAGVAMDLEEHLAIRLADGQYVRENEPYRHREPELALLLHYADGFSMRQEKLARTGGNG